MIDIFDEYDDRWLRVYKVYVIIMFWLYIAAAVVLCICGWCEEIYILEEPFIDGIICLAGGALFAFIHLVTNMIVLNFFTNVQSIRKEVWKLGASTNGGTVVKPVSGTAGTVSVFRDNAGMKPAPAGQWACKYCGTHNSTNYTQCKKCGNYKG